MLIVCLEGPDKCGKTSIFQYCKGNKHLAHVSLVDRAFLSQAVYNEYFNRLPVEDNEATFRHLLISLKALSDANRIIILYVKRAAKKRTKYIDEYKYTFADHERLDELFAKYIAMCIKEGITVDTLDNNGCIRHHKMRGLYRLIKYNDKEIKNV